MVPLTMRKLSRDVPVSVTTQALLHPWVPHSLHPQAPDRWWSRRLVMSLRFLRHRPRILPTRAVTCLTVYAPACFLEQLNP